MINLNLDRVLRFKETIKLDTQKKGHSSQRFRLKLKFIQRAESSASSIFKVITLPLHGVAKTFKFRHRSFGVLALEKQQSCMVFHLFSMLYYVRIEKSPYILIVIRFNVNRFQCYSMLIQNNIATIFSRSLEFCSWKMSATADIAGIYLLHPF